MILQSDVTFYPSIQIYLSIYLNLSMLLNYNFILHSLLLKTVIYHGMHNMLGFINLEKCITFLVSHAVQ